MGKHAITLFLFCVIFMFACRKEDFISPTLVQAEAIMEEYPDSALQLLNSIQFPEKHSEEDHATWCLLITEARDKNYVEHTSDSVINVAVAYFDKQKDWVRKAQAYYYGGRVNEELAQLEDALAYYLKARSYAKKTTDYHLQGLINMYIGNLQWYLNRQDVALIAHKDAYAYFLADADTLSCGYTLRDIGRVYMASKQADSASFYLRQALTIAEKFVKLSLQASVESDLAILYEEKGEYTKALKYAFLSVNHTPDREKLSSCYLVIGTSFYKMNCLDSAQFYLEQGLSSTQLYTRAGANRALSILYKHQKDYVLSDQYLSDYVYCRDSIEARYDAPKMKELEVRYNNEKAEHEKDRLLQDQKNMQLLLILSFVLGLSVFLGGYLLYQRRIKLKDKALYEANNVAHYYENKYIESIKKIKVKENQIVQWSTKVQEKEHLLEGNMLQLNLSQENKAQLEEKNLKMKVLENRNEKLEEQIGNSKRSSDSQKAKLIEKELLLKRGEEELKQLQKEKDRLECEILDSRDLNKSNELLKQNIQTIKKDMEQLKEDTTELAKNNQNLMTFILRDSEIQKRLTEGGGHLTSELWLSIQCKVKEIDSDFAKKLKKQAPMLSDKEKQLCYLIKLNVPLLQIAVLLDVSKPSISRYKSLIVKKHFGRTDCILLDRLLLML